MIFDIMAIIGIAISSALSIILILLLVMVIINQISKLSKVGRFFVSYIYNYKMYHKWYEKVTSEPDK